MSAKVQIKISDEQITNFKYVKPVSDVWSMAATIYKMLTGTRRRPFESQATHARLLQMRFADTLLP